MTARKHTPIEGPFESRFVPSFRKLFSKTLTLIPASMRNKGRYLILRNEGVAALKGLDLTFGVVLFSILVQRLTIKPLLRILKLASTGRMARSSRLRMHAKETHFESPQRGVKLSDVGEACRHGSSAGATKGQLQFQSVPDADITLLFAPRKSVRLNSTSTTPRFPDLPPG